ncbi:PqqD family protein [Paenibacillus sediminis]|uniref:PqqD family protein n=1 Tax=Paenibacillus sediminis TaxID=664909 RepID=A0ABS4H1C5_9BACL|nr:PqqD family protein [Paenibacillus sediminis]MBP1936333.1 hypothetical protein [Paenibacillus sediminis]
MGMWIWPVLKRKSNVNQNLLQMVPILKEHLTVQYDIDGMGIVLVPRLSWIERQSVRFLNQPDTITVQVDLLGSEVLKRCDGTYSVDQIADELTNKYGELADPLLPRLVMFTRQLEMIGWIKWMDSDDYKTER